METNTPYNYCEKPGMDQTARECVGRWFALLMLLVAGLAFIAACIGLVWLFKNNQDDFLRVIVAGGFFAAAGLLVSLAAKGRHGTGTRIICGFGAAAAFTASIVQVLAVVG